MLDLQTLTALNKFWQDKFDKRHPEAARRRDARDRAALRRKKARTILSPRKHRSA